MADIGIGAAANVGAECAKGIFLEAKRHVRYVICYKKNVEKFEKRLEQLMKRREAVQQKVGEEERNGMKRTAEVEHWFKQVDEEVDKATKEVKGLEDKAAKGKCFIGLCPNIKSRHQLSTKAEDGANIFNELIQGSQFNTLTYRDLPEDMITAANSKDFEAFESRKVVFDEIMAALKSPTTSMMGVHGMSGVGKSTLVKEVARQVKRESLFDSVVVVLDVKPSPVIETLQDSIGEQLGLYLQEKTQPARRNRLRERLKNEKSILIILDDIWGTLDLEEVGIPFGDEHRGCKILLTSRNLDVLTTNMGASAENTFLLGVLDENEAWELFKKIAGDKVQSDAELPPIAYDVAQKCARLPVAIITVAKALKNKGLPAWKDALRMLQSPSPSNFKDHVSKGAYNAIKLSYEYLESKEHRHFFLLCCVLLHRKIDLSSLLKYAVGLRLFSHVRTLEAAQDRLLTLVNNLKAASLLSEDDGMHDLIRDVALAIASEINFAFFLKDDDVLNLKDWLDEETMQKYKGIVFRFPSMTSEFPGSADELNCPQLAFLAMDGAEDSSMKLPPNIFQRMAKLQVLDLNNLTFSNSSPPLISHLKSLRTLCLRHSKELGDISTIGELNNLEILSLANSDIEKLPREIGMLKRLKLLDLSDCYQFKIILPGTLSRLSQLEELYMGGSSVQWEEEATNDGERHGDQVREQHSNANASLNELKALSCLHTLEVRILDAKFVPKDYHFSENLRRFKICIGEEWNSLLWHDKSEYSRILNLNLKSTSIDQLGHWAETLLEKTQALYLSGSQHNQLPFFHKQFVFRCLESLTFHDCGRLEYLFLPSVARSLVKLKSLEIKQCKCLRDVIFTDGIEEENNDAICFLDNAIEESSPPEALSRIRNLTSCDSKNVDHIWKKLDWELPNVKVLEVSLCDDLINFGPFLFSLTFKSLTTLTVYKCERMINLVTASVVQNLVHLTTMKISSCEAMREIVANELEEDTTSTSTSTSAAAANARIICFSNLKSLRLENLRSLECFCTPAAGNNYTQLQFPSLQDLIVVECHALKIFYDGVLSTPCLHLQGVKSWIFEKQGRWADDLNTTIRQMYNERFNDILRITLAVLRNAQRGVM